MSSAALSVEDAVSALSDLPANDAQNPADLDTSSEHDEEDIDNASELDNADTAEAVDPADAEDDGAEEPTEDLDDSGQTDEPETAIDPPVVLGPEDREAFKKLPTEAQKILVRQSNLVSTQLHKKSTEFSEKNRLLDARIEALGDEIQSREERLREWAKVDWESERVNNPDDALAALAQMQKEQREYAELTSKREQAEKLAQEDFARTRNHELVNIFPEILDAEKQPQIVKDLSDYATGLGYSAEELAGATARELKILHDAARATKFKGKKLSMKPKPGVKTRKAPIKGRATASSSKNGPKSVMQRMRANPSQENAIEALMSID